MDIEKERQRFEGFARSRRFSAERDTGGGGGYRSIIINWMWEAWQACASLTQPSETTQSDRESSTLTFAERQAVRVGGIVTVDVLYNGNPHQRIASIAADLVQLGCVLVSYCPPDIDWDYWKLLILIYISRRGWHEVEGLEGRRGNRRYTPTRRDKGLMVASDGQ